MSAAEIGAKMLEPNSYSPIALAYLGDAVFELHVRMKVMSEGNEQASKLHVKSRGYVNAKAQSAMYFKILPLLTQEEQAVMKRGRNAKSFSKAKNASTADYRHATGLETLLGYLQAKGERERLCYILDICTEGEKEISE